ncbi:hypothetical protein ACGYKB_18460 [Sulfitobacter sp. 916]|uniref:hypothetical protein n=1 Tax=Sulfitobacter sp. 916 TaxID=3368559 RepID=UPI0037470E16
MQERDSLFPLILFVILGLGAAFVLIPKGELDQEAQLAALSDAQALSLLNTSQEPLSPRLAFRQSELTAAAGDGLLAEKLLADLETRSEPTAAISAARADLALRAGDLAQAAVYLAAAQERMPHREQRRKLAALYYHLGDWAAERRTLISVPLTELSGPELVRLVDLTAAEGATAEALDVARAALPLAGQSAPLLAERLTAIALRTGQSDLLARIAPIWLSKPQAAAVAASVARVMTVRPRSAKIFAAAVVAETPKARVLLAKAFTDAGLYDVARLLIQPWMAFRLQTAERWETVILYAGRSGDFGPLEDLLRQMGPHEIPPKNAFLPLIRYGGEGALLPYQRWLTPAYLESAPLVEAAWALTRQRPDEAFAALQRAAQMERDPALWHAIADRMHDTEYRDRLSLLAPGAFKAQARVPSQPVYERLRTPR